MGHHDTHDTRTHAPSHDAHTHITVDCITPTSSRRPRGRLHHADRDTRTHTHHTTRTHAQHARTAAREHRPWPGGPTTPRFQRNHAQHTKSCQSRPEMNTYA